MTLKEKRFLNMSKETIKVLHEEISNEVIVDSNGEVTSQESSHKKTYAYPKEPNFVKLYLDHLGAFNGLQTSMSPVLYEFLKYSTYADPSEENGGMILFCNKALKEMVARTCKVSLTRVDHCITEFVKKGYMVRIKTGLYQFNPFLFGKGDWRDISKIRATYDYQTGEVVAEIVHEEEELMNTAADEISNITEQKLNEIGA